MASVWAYQQPPCSLSCLRRNAGSSSCKSLFLGDNKLVHTTQISFPRSIRSTSLTGLRRLVVTAAAKENEDAPAKKKIPSAVKRARISEQRRIYNKSRKSEVKTRMKKVFLALTELKKKSSAAQPEDLKPIEVLIGEAYSVIDRAIKVNTLHKNTGRRRKSRLARAKKAVEIALGWYVPSAPAPETAAA